MTKETTEIVRALLERELNENKATLLFYEHQKALPFQLRVIGEEVNIEDSLPRLRVLDNKLSKALEEIVLTPIK